MNAYLGATVESCTIVENEASHAVGGSFAFMSDIRNCIVYFNTRSDQENWAVDGGSTYEYCCTTPRPKARGMSPTIRAS